MARLDQSDDLEAALHSLHLAHDPTTTDRLLAHLTHTEPRVRELVLQLLRHSQAPQAIDQLLPLLEDPEPAVRAAAITTIGQHPAQEAAVAALTHAACDPDAAVRRNAIWELGEIGHPRGISAIRAGLRDESLIVREVAILAAMRCDDPAIQANLTTCLHDPIDAVRDAAAFALAQLSRPPQP
jgi:HEAT repeat protein